MTELFNTAFSSTEFEQPSSSRPYRPCKITIIIKNMWISQHLVSGFIKTNRLLKINNWTGCHQVLKDVAETFAKHW